MLESAPVNLDCLRYASSGETSSKRALLYGQASLSQISRTTIQCVTQLKPAVLLSPRSQNLVFYDVLRTAISTLKLTFGLHLRSR